MDTGLPRSPLYMFKFKINKTFGSSSFIIHYRIYPHWIKLQHTIAHSYLASVRMINIIIPDILVLIYIKVKKKKM